MRGKLGLGPWAFLALGAVACSSSNGVTTGDGGADGADGHVGMPDAGKEGGHIIKPDASEASTGHDSGPDGSMPDAPSDAPVSAPIARFKLAGGTVPSFLDVPFPSDVYLSGGKVMSTIPGVDAVILENSNFITNELGKLNGFSRYALSLFYVDDATQVSDAGLNGVAAIDPASLPASESACTADTSSVFLLDLSATDPAAARIGCRAQFHDDRAFAPKVARPVVAIGPARGVVLEEGHQYATVMTSRVKAVGGAPVAPSADFLAISNGTDAVYKPALATANTLLAGALGSDHASIVDIAPFTTNSATSTLFQMRTSLEASAAPPLLWDSASMSPMGAVKFAAPVAGVLPLGFTASLDALLGVVAPTAKLPDGSDDPDATLPVRAHDKISAIGTAVFNAQNYMQQLGGYSTLNNATFSYDASGNVIPDPTHPTAKIWVTFFIPSSPMPPAGYPVVIVIHGLGESRQDEAFNLANVFANQGWAVAAIDTVTFGARAPEAHYQIDTLTPWQNAPGATYKGPDGLGDPLDGSSMPSVTGSTNGPTDFFGTLLNMGALRDQFRQAEIDNSQLARVLATSPVLTELQTGAVAPVIDGSKIAYFGNSLGAIEGAATAAIEPLIQSFILNVAGGGVVTELAAHSAVVSTDLNLAAGFNFGLIGDQFSESHPLDTLLQTAIDPGDPLNFASYLIKSPGTVNGVALKPKNVMQVEVVYDNYVPNEANEALARAMGIGLAMPNVGTNSGVDTLALVKDPSMVPDLLPLTNVAANDAGLIQNTPMNGVTGVLVQTMPGVHGDDFQQSASLQTFAIPYGRYGTKTPFVKLDDAGPDPTFDINCSYRDLQAAGVRFISDTFAGNVPSVAGFLAPVRDFDQDGVPDSTDSDPNNPQIH